ncbi:HlyD family type I secretion periplasmic adaptor subunit [uncultured Hyphomicrobium sp.]|uniref:HlyD family type I secretion periplasmic adaptor subunit n=1 Tax=uncultured Hyphomicrobium sp. TaxID=194373 RepID=UPI0025F5C7F0|nr:HlyD family type I secretion periplasmic adaptor subunit [uncultured Hyphomicrobium sp.]
MSNAFPSMREWHREVPRSASRPIVIGLAVLGVWGLGFGAWAAMAPLDGAVVAAGRFVATGQNKLVQHLEGGIVRDTLVKEGDLVEASQTLLRLDDTAANAKLRRLTLRKYRLSAIQARLDAEISGRDTIEVPAVLASQLDDPEIKAIVNGQVVELNARSARLGAEELVLRKEIAALQESINGFQVQAQSIERRMEMFDEELKDKSGLVERQLVRKPEIFALQRAQAGLAGDLGELTGRAADARERVARADQQIAQIRSAAIAEAVEALRKAEADFDDVAEQIRAARDVVDRVDVRAPVRGIVVKLNYNTPGGVVGAGDVILELLPIDDALLIEARVKPSDILHIKEGQAALVKFSAMNQRVTPMMEGIVKYVSADAVPDQDPRPGVGASSERRSSFIVRVELAERPSRHAQDFRAAPGMPAEIYIKTAQRTFFDYMMRPVQDSFARAFRES